MNKLSEFFRDFFEKIKSSRSIKIGLGVAVGCLLMVVAYFSYSNKDESEAETIATSITEKYVIDLENKVEKLLNNIDKVSEASVAITLQSGFEYVYAQEKEIKDTSTGTLTTSEILLVSGQPVVVKEIFPVINGVVVVCDDAKDFSVKFNILQAIQTALEISNDKITIIC